MPQLIEGGHLYIAQPPLYKVTRGKSEAYLKDQKGLENYLIDTGLDDAILESRDGSARARADLRDVVERARLFTGQLQGLHSRYDPRIVEQAALVGALTPEVLDAGPEAPAVQKLCARLDAISDEFERGWTAQARQEPGEPASLMLVREVRGVKEAHILDHRLATSVDAQNLNKLVVALQDVFADPPLTLRRGETTKAIDGPVTLFNAVQDLGRKGIVTQRFKGLGEMTATQLWETTLERDSRTLLRVKVGELDDADDIFSKLMGDVVEPRRDFIQQNALTVANLDI